MEATNRIIVNTIVQYVRSGLYMLLTLLATRYILVALGHSDYGLYCVVGSMVYMLNFVTLSLSSSTQRFLSVSHGSTDASIVKSIFANAFLLHALLALILALAMAAVEPLLMGYLTVPEERLGAAQFVYYMVLLMVLLSFLTSPVRALFIARENIVYVSIVEIVDAVLKLLGAIALPFIKADTLCLYAIIMLLLQVFNLFAYAFYAGRNYEECHFPSLKAYSKQTMRRLTGFAIWNVYAVGSTVARTQGLAIIINHFLGTLVNAAYGIALQMSNATSFIALSILNAINPQLMKAEGAGERERMLLLATKESKYSFLTLSLLLIPLIAEMPSVLTFWLRTPPDHTIAFCRLILIEFIADQLTIGLSSANQAIGHIRDYSLLTSTIRLLTLPAAYILLLQGVEAESVLVASLAITLVIGLTRLPFLHITAGLRVNTYLHDVALRNLIPLAGICLSSCLMLSLTLGPLRFIATEVVAISTGIVLIYFFALENDERRWLTQKLTHR